MRNRSNRNEPGFQFGIVHNTLVGLFVLDDPPQETFIKYREHARDSSPQPGRFARVTEVFDREMDMSIKFSGGSSLAPVE